MPAGTIVNTGSLVTPGGQQGIPGPNAISQDAGNLATFGSDGLISVPPSGIWLQRLRTYNSLGNPNFESSQITVGNANTAAAGTVVAKWIDRWQLNKTAATAAITQQQVNTPVNGNIPGTNYLITSKALSISVATAQATLAAGEYLFLMQQVEGPRFRPLLNDVHSLQALVYSNVATSFSICLRDSNASHSIVWLCTVPANTLTLFPVPNIAWSPSGVYSVLPGAIGYSISIVLASGGTYVAPAAGAWQNGNFLAAPGTSNFLATAGNTFYCFFLQHQPGPVCSHLIDLQFDQNVWECQRYYQKNFMYGTVPAAGTSQWQAVGQWVGGTTVRSNVRFPRELARNPTATNMWGNTGAANSCYIDGYGDDAIPSFSVISSGFEMWTLSTTPTASQWGPALGNYQVDTGW